MTSQQIGILKNIFVVAVKLILVLFPGRIMSKLPLPPIKFPDKIAQVLHTLRQLGCRVWFHLLRLGYNCYLS